MNQNTVVVLTVSALALGAWWLSGQLKNNETGPQHTAFKADPVDASDNSDLSALISAINNNANQVEQSLSSLAEEINRLSGRVSAIENQDQSDSLAAPSELLTDPFENISEEEQQRLVDEQIAQYFADVEQAFSEQEVDEAWSANADYEITQLFDSNQFNESSGANLTSIECRASTCKLQVELQEGPDSSFLEDDLISSLGAKGFTSIKGYKNKQVGENARTFYAGDPKAVPQQFQQNRPNSTTTSVN